ncbi:MAG: glycosyltransferase family 2 protein [Pirellulales bacterium]
MSNTSDTQLPSDPWPNLAVPVVPSYDSRDVHEQHAPPADPQTLHRVEQTIAEAEAALTQITEEQQAPPCTLTVAMPVFNESATIRQIVRRVQQSPLTTELIIVDDASTDGTREILEELADEPGIRVYFHDQNQGKGAALRTAFQHATSDLVIVQDADLEYDPSEYARLIEPIVDNRADVVYGSRFLGDSPGDGSRVHRWGNRMLTRVSNLLTGQRLTDMETCYKVFRRSVLQQIPVCQNRFGFEPEITAKLARRKLRITEVPISYQRRSYGEGKKIGIRDAFSALYCMFRYSLAD